ncbi:hypothetical protein O3M35_010207 [Rhynocoris fuscipes]|uniref:Uncharacterized protein n=1 Tax=Rhynocoris fuscipes TaxID=488301 RepID=A0AAW1CZI4_9HEMI
MQIFRCNFLHSVQHGANYIKISSESDQQCCQKNSSKLRILCSPYLKNGLSQLKFFLYSILILSNLDLISFGAPSVQLGCHFI